MAVGGSGDRLRRPGTALALTPLEVASGMVVGVDHTTVPLDTEPAAPSARAAIETVLAGALEASPCVVSFSGGRDSSALLALAATVARREGLAPPVAATVRFPGVEDADETDWQEGMLAHAGVSDWVRIDVTDELDALGPLATGILARHGMLYPFNTHFMVPVLGVASGGVVVTGMGGDELFTPLEWARVAAVRYGRDRPEPRDLLRAGVALARGPLQRAALGRRLDVGVPWLRPEPQRTLRRQVLDWIGRQPVRFDRAVTEWWWRARYLQAGRRSMQLVAADNGAAMVHPYCEPGVLAAVAAGRGALGWRDRTEAMAELFGDVLPPRTVGRSTKALFDQVVFNHHSRDFLVRWGGEGIDPDLVDTDALARVWRGPQFDFRTVALLQAAWLAGAGAGASRP